MPPPKYRSGDTVMLYSDARLYATLDDLCRNENEDRVPPGEYRVADLGRDQRFDHDQEYAHDGYFYRLFRGGEQAGWQWQNILKRMASEEVPENEYLQDVRMDYLDAQERPIIDTDWQYEIGQAVELTSLMFCWRRLNDLGRSANRVFRLRPRRVHITDRGALFAEGRPPFYPAKVEVPNPLPVYLVTDARHEEFWACEPLLDAAREGANPDKTAADFRLSPPAKANNE